MSFVQGKTENPNDKIYTPRHISKKIIDMFYTGGSVLDPFKGDGSFYDQLPTDNKDWAEIDLGRDFFDINKQYDWIISNPPYSKFTEVMKHSYKLADNIVYLTPLTKIVSSMGRVRDMEEYGGIVKLYIIPAGKCGFPFGFPACAVHIQRGYRGKVEWAVEKQGGG